jgi:hypothetical protein
MNVVMRCLDWLTSRERRMAGRQGSLKLVAHYWDGGAPLAHEVKDISPRGLYLCTAHRWYPGTLVMLSLQRIDLPSSHPNYSIAVRARVVRSDSDGVGFSFVMSGADSNRDTRSELIGGADKKSFERFLRQIKEQG